MRRVQGLRGRYSSSTANVSSVSAQPVRPFAAPCATSHSRGAAQCEARSSKRAQRHACLPLVKKGKKRKRVAWSALTQNKKMRKFSKQLECEEIQKKDAFLFATFSSYASGSLRLRRLLKARSRSTNATTLSGEPPRIGTLIAAHPARALLTMQ